MAEENRFTVTGIAYPKAQPGSGPANARITSDLKDPQSYYRDPALQLTENDLDRNQNFRGLPLCVEHKHNPPHPGPVGGGGPGGSGGRGSGGACGNCVGEVLEARVLKDNSVYIVASVFASTPTGAAAKERIIRKELSGFSMGYLNHRDSRDNRVVTGRTICEISLCAKPFFAGCDIAVSASAADSYKNDDETSVNYYWIPIMASTPSETTASAGQAQAPAPASAGQGQAAAPATQAGQASSPVGEAPSQVLKDAEAMAKESAEYQAKMAQAQRDQDELNAFRAERAARQAAEEEKRRQEAQKMLAAQKQAMGDKFTPEYEKSMLNVAGSSVSVNASAQFMEAQQALTNRYVQAEKEKAELAATLAKAQEELKKREVETKVLETHVQQSRQNMRAGPPSTQQVQPVAVAASAGQASSGSGLKFGDCYVPVAHAGWEHQLFRDANPNLTPADMASSSLPINASGNAAAAGAPNGFIAFEPLPVHANAKNLPASMRNVKDEHGNPTGEAWLSKMINEFDPQVTRSAKYAFVSKDRTYRLPDGRTHATGLFVEDSKYYVSK